MGSRTPPRKTGVCLWAGAGLRGHWQRLVNAAAQNVAHTSENRAVMHLEEPAVLYE